MSVVELYAGKDTTFSVNERKQLDDILVRLQKLEPIYKKIEDAIKAVGQEGGYT